MNKMNPRHRMILHLMSACALSGELDGEKEPPIFKSIRAFLNKGDLSELMRLEARKPVGQVIKKEPVAISIPKPKSALNIKIGD